MFVDFKETIEHNLRKVGTLKRDEFERKVNKAVISFCGYFWV